MWLGITALNDKTFAETPKMCGWDLKMSGFASSFSCGANQGAT